MTAMKDKIKSQRGASITFALLLFLVCAIISGIVVVAATAVGGRASQMAELDQRYYAVNSAAELLKDVLEDQTVKVTTGTKTVSTVDQDEKIVEEGTPTDLPSVSILEGSTVIDLSADTTNLVATAASNLAGKVVDLKPLVLTANVSGTNQEGLGVTMIPTIDVDKRKLYIKVSNTNASKGTYTLGLTFKADIVQNENEYTSYSDLTLTDSGFTRKKTTEKTTVSTIKWKLIDLQTMLALESKS